MKLSLLTYDDDDDFGCFFLHMIIFIHCSYLIIAASLKRRNICCDFYSHIATVLNSAIPKYIEYKHTISVFLENSFFVYLLDNCVLI